MLKELATREEIVSEARSWIGTPYKKTARIKGAGCDCATFLFCVYHACGLIGEEDTGVFAGDWWAHITEELYMQRIIRHAAKVADAIACKGFEALPGNIVLTRAVRSKVYNHSGIVVGLGRIVHAFPPVVCEVNIATDPTWCRNQVAIFDPWVKRGN